MASSRTLTYRVVGDEKDFLRAMQNVDRRLGGLEKNAKKSSGVMGKAFKGAAGAIAGAFAIDRLVGFGKAMVTTASDVNESLTKNQQLFGEHAKGIDKWSRSTATSMGIARDEALEATGVFGNLFVALDIGPKKAANMSTELVKLAGDLASFNNASPEDAMEALRSGLVGETEPLRKFGVNMNDATLRAEAMRQGLIKTTKEALTPQQKALAAYGLVFQQTKKAQGDFQRTSDGLANQQRILRAQFRDVTGELGTALLPVMTDVVQEITKFITQVREGKGAGGDFRRTLEDIWRAAKPIAEFFKDHPQLIGAAVAAWGTYKAVMIAASVAQKFKAFRLIFTGAVPIATAEGAKAGAAYATGAASTGGMGTLPGKLGPLKGRLVTLFRGFGVIAGVAMAAEIAGKIERAIANIAIPGVNDSPARRDQLPGTGTGPGGLPSPGEMLGNLGKFFFGKASSPRAVAPARAVMASAGPTARMAMIPTPGSDNTYGSGGRSQGGWKPCELTYYKPSLGGINADSTPGTYADGSAVDEQRDWVCAAPPNFPFGTIIEFKYGGVGVRVMVRDRGGAIQGNRFDLIYNAARALGITRIGRVQASYRVVGRATTRSRGGGGSGATTRAVQRATRPSGPSYPLASRGAIIGTPHAGTHTLGNWQSDNAVDIRVAEGTPVLAVRDGVVTKVAIKPNDGGRFAGSQVTMRLDVGGSVFYTHLASVAVKTGQRVRKGQMIGRSGSANGVPHLHFGTERGDPRKLLAGSHIGTSGGTGRLVSAVQLDPMWEPTTRFERALARSDIRTARAEATLGTRDDIRAAEGRQKLLERRIRGVRKRLGGNRIGPTRRLNLQQHLADLLSQRASLINTIADLNEAFEPEFSFQEVQDAALEFEKAVARPGSKKELAALGGQSMVLGTRLNVLRRELKRKGLSRKRRMALMDEIRGITDTLRSNEDRIREIMAPPEVEPPPEPTLLTPERENALSAIEAAAALAALDPAVNGADTFAADELVRFWQDRLTFAQQHGRNDWVTEAATNLRAAVDNRNSLEDAIKANTEAVTDSTQALADAHKALVDELKANRELTERIASQSYSTIARGLADWISGQIGGRTGMGFAAVGVPGSVARF